MKLRQNPLFADKIDKVADVDRLQSPTVYRQQTASHRREIRDQRRLDTAAEALAGFSRETSIYGFTKGQFSLIQLLTEALKITGPAHLVLSTWTAANQDVTDILDFCDAGIVLSARWLVDLTFTKRTPQLADRIRKVFGDDAIRVAKNHAKFAMIGNVEWQVVVRTSMNLNHNPRFENFEIAHDPALYAFHAHIIDEIWHRQNRAIDRMRPYEIHKHFHATL